MNLDNLPSGKDILAMIGLPVDTEVTIRCKVKDITDYGRKIVLELPLEGDGLIRTIELDSGYVEDLLNERLLEQKAGKPANRTVIDGRYLN